MKNNYFILSALLFCTHVFCAENNKHKNIVHDLFDREVGKKVDNFRIFSKLEYRNKLLADCQFSSGELYPQHIPGTLLEGGGIIYNIRDYLYSDENMYSSDMDFLVDELKNRFEGKTLEFVCSAVVRLGLAYQGHPCFEKVYLKVYPILRRLIRVHNLNINHITSWGCGNNHKMSPLHLAEYDEDSNLIAFLIKYGADISIKDADNRTPYENFMNRWRDQPETFFSQEPYKTIADLLKPPKRI